MATQNADGKLPKFKIVGGPGQWRAILAAFGEKAGFQLTLVMEGKNKKLFKTFFSLKTFTTKRVDNLIKYEFTGRLPNGLDARGTYNPETNKGWVEYYDENDEKKANEEKLKQILLLGQLTGSHFTKYLSFKWFGFNGKRPTIKIISHYLETSKEKCIQNDLLLVIEKHFKRLGILYSYERDESHLIVELTSDCSILEDFSNLTL